MDVDSYFVPTRCSQSKKLKHELIVHNTRRPKPKAIPDENPESSHPHSKPTEEEFSEIDMKKARFELYKFAQSGLDSLEKQKSKLELAVKLGARPPKNKSINYKELQVQRQEQKIKEKEQLEELRRLGERVKSKPKVDFKEDRRKLKMKRRVGSGILNTYGKVRKVPK